MYLRVPSRVHLLHLKLTFFDLCHHGLFIRFISLVGRRCWPFIACFRCKSDVPGALLAIMLRWLGLRDIIIISRVLLPCENHGRLGRILDMLIQRVF